MTRALLLCLVLAACGGDASTDPLTTTSAEPYCRRACEHSAPCNEGQLIDECVTDCVDQIAGWAREDALADLVECEEPIACSEPADACFEACTPTSDHLAYEQACRDFLAPCAIDGPEIERVCETDPGRNQFSLLCFITPAIVRDLRDCFTSAGATCSSYASCETTVFEAYGIQQLL